MPIRNKENHISHLLIRCKLNSQMPISISLIKLRTSLEQRNSRIAMTFSDRMMQSCLPCAVGGIERTLVGQHQLYHGHGADCGGTVQGKLATLVFDAGRCFVGEEESS